MPVGRYSVTVPAPELGQDLADEMGPPLPPGGSGTDWLSTSIASITGLAKAGSELYATREATIANQRAADAAATNARLLAQRNNALLSSGSSSTLPVLLIGGGVLVLLSIYVLKSTKKGRR